MQYGLAATRVQSSTVIIRVLAGSTWAAGSWLPPAGSANHCRTPCRMPAGVLQGFCEGSAGFRVMNSSANDLHEIDRCPAEHSAILPAMFCTLVVLPA